MKKHLQKGFTLIELLVVISIIGILITVGIVSYRKTNQISRDARRKADIEQIRQALETYRSENNQYPQSASWQTDLTSGDYINNIPSDPKSNSNYVYQRPSSTTYNLCAYLETGSGTACGSADCGDGTCNYEVNNP